MKIAKDKVVAFHYSLKDQDGTELEQTADGDEPMVYLHGHGNILEGLEQGEGVDCVYLDFSKAFDKVETGVLLHKLRNGKVLGKMGCWIAACLDSAQRQQAVVVDGQIIEDASPAEISRKGVITF